MNIFASMAGAGLTVSFLHAALPNHWLPFVLAGRAQKWSVAKTLSIVIVAGGGHVVMTTILGVLVVSLGLAVSHYVEEWSATVAGGILIACGGYYLVRHLRGKSHVHLFGNHHHDHDYDSDGKHQHEHPAHDHLHEKGGRDLHQEHGRSLGVTAADAVPVLSLIAMLTFSPCEGFLAIYLVAWPHGWMAFAVLSGVLAVGTLAGMLVFTWLTMRGMERVSFPSLDRYEGLVLAVVLIGLGLGVMLLHEHV